MEKNLEMADRFRALVDYKTAGDRKAFCALMDWTPQYLNKMLNGDNVGLSPLLAVLRKLPDVNARWLLLGQGAMIDAALGDVKSRLFALMALEQYMPFMSADEIAQVENGKTDWDEAHIARWMSLRQKRDDAIRKAMHP